MNFDVVRLYLADGAQDHQKPAEEEVRASAGGTVAASAAPAHEITGQRGQGEEEADETSAVC
jgi:hypothetical protein